MGQRSIRIQPVVADDLVKFMHLRGIRNESEAVQVAVCEALERTAGASSEHPDFRSWLGTALQAPTSAHPRFQTDGALWK